MAPIQELMKKKLVFGAWCVFEEEILDEEIEQLIAERQEARKSKNFARADEIRDILKEKGITLKDTPQGVQIIRG